MIKRPLFVIPLSVLFGPIAACTSAPGSTGERVTTTSSAYSATPQNAPWLIVLCNSSDNPPITQGRDVSFYNNLFLATGTGSATDYWNSQSYGNVSLANSIVTPSWQNTGQTKAWHLSQSRATNIQTCVNSVQNAYDLSSFYNVVAVYNFQIDEGSSGVTLGGRGVPGVIIDPDSPETGILHEMGHGFGLAHSFSDQGVEYGDPYDLMSAMRVDSYSGQYCVPPGASYGCANGPGLNAFTRWQLGWLPPAQRQMWWPASAGTPLRTENVTLAARNESPGALPQILYVPASPTFMYTVEWVNADNFDQGIGQNTLLIHKINYGDQRTFLVTSSGGSQTVPGNPFYDSASGVHIELTGSQGTPATATVQVTVDGHSGVWGPSPSAGSPPADSSLVVWQGVNTAGGDTLPSNAYASGSDPNAGTLYPCRVWFNGVQLGKVVGGQCSYPWGGTEHWENKVFEVLTVQPHTQVAWADFSGSLPANAVPAGFDGGNGTMYLCRALVNGYWTPGKEIWDQCSVSSGGTQMFYSAFQVLTVAPVPPVMTCSGSSSCPGSGYSANGLTNVTCQPLSTMGGFTLLLERQEGDQWVTVQTYELQTPGLGATLTDSYPTNGSIQTFIYRVCSSDTVRTNCGSPFSVQSVSDCACTPYTCSDLGAQCGSIGDRCGGTLSCGMCATGNSCSLNMCCPDGTSWSTVTNSCSANPLVCKRGFGDCGGYCCKCGPGQPC